VRSIRAELAVIGEISLENLILSSISYARLQADGKAGLDDALREIARTVHGTLGVRNSDDERLSTDVEFSIEDCSGGSIAWLRSERCLVGVWRQWRAATTPFVAAMMHPEQVFAGWQRDLARMALIHQTERLAWHLVPDVGSCGCSMPEVLLRSIAVGLMVVDASAKVVLSNEFAESWLAESGCVEIVAGRLTARRSDVRERLVKALRKATSAVARQPVVVALPPQEGEEGALSGLLTFVPLQLATPHVLLICGTWLPGAGLCDLVLEALGLTHSERRLARFLILGHSIEQAAQEANVTTSTARTYLKRIFAKTGVRRQSELVASIMAITPPLQLDAAQTGMRSLAD
jgi:DNA-binding CsgD family transcriptional regulator